MLLETKIGETTFVHAKRMNVGQYEEIQDIREQEDKNNLTKSIEVAAIFIKEIRYDDEVITDNDSKIEHIRSMYIDELDELSKVLQPIMTPSEKKTKKGKKS